MRRYRRTVIGVVIVGLLLFPVYWMLLTSLRSEAEAVQTPPELLPDGADLSAYDIAVLDNPAIRRAFLNSLIASRPWRTDSPCFSRSSSGGSRSSNRRWYRSAASAAPTSWASSPACSRRPASRLASRQMRLPRSRYSSAMS